MLFLSPMMICFDYGQESTLNILLTINVLYFHRTRIEKVAVIKVIYYLYEYEMNLLIF